MLTRDEIARRCAEVFSRHLMMSRAYLFGSYARGDADEFSDVSVCYDYDVEGVFAAPQGFAFFGEHGDMRDELERALGLPVDLLVTPREEACAFASQRRFARVVQRDRRPVYERQGVRPA